MDNKQEQQTRRRKRRSVLVRISVATAIVITLLNLCAAVGTFFSAKYKLGQYFGNVLGEKIQTAIKIGTEDIRMLADYVGSMPEVFPNIGQTLSEGSFDYLKMVFESSGRLMHYQGWVVADMDGQIVHTTYSGYTDEQLAAFHEFLMNVKNDDDKHYHGYLDLLNQGVGVVTAHVYPDSEGKDGAIVVVCQTLIEDYAFLKRSAETNGMEVSLIRDGVYSASSMSDREELNVVGKEIDDKQIVESVYRGEIQHRVENIGDKTFISIYTPIPDYRKHIIGIHNASLDVTVMNELIPFLVSGIGIGGSSLGLISLIILIVYFKRTLTDHLRSLAKTADGIARGDLRTDVVVPQTNDEVQLLGESVFNMHSSLKSTIGALVRTSEILNTSSRGLSNSSQQLSMGANRQAASLEEVSSSLEEMAGNIHMNTENALRTDKLMSDTDKTVGDIAGEATTSMEQTQAINGSIENINDLVDQTNILSLNASVEAARAGSQGRGFAVVAKEVGRLAEQTKVTAEEVSANASLSIKGAEHINELLDEVSPQIHEVSKLVQEIATASAEQGQGIDHINVAIADLNKVTQETAANAEEIAASAEELSVTAEKMNDILRGFKV